MNLVTVDIETERRTTSNDVFEHLKGEIVSLRLTPGTKLSEAEVAKAYGVSRQPVREAFIRLDSANLVDIRPQRATIVRRISRSEVVESRFIRTAVELEIVRRACARYDGAQDAEFADNLAQQREAVSTGDTDRFNTLDYAFHRTICQAGDAEFAFRSIAENKIHVDRLCMLSLAKADELESVLEDHIQLFACLQARDMERMIQVTRRHLSRLTATLDFAQSQYPEYFEG